MEKKELRKKDGRRGDIETEKRGRREIAGRYQSLGLGSGDSRGRDLERGGNGCNFFLFPPWGKLN
jgi:hypothetical protein